MFQCRALVRYGGWKFGFSTARRITEKITTEERCSRVGGWYIETKWAWRWESTCFWLLAAGAFENITSAHVPKLDTSTAAAAARCTGEQKQQQQQQLWWWWWVVRLKCGSTSSQVQAGWELFFARLYAMYKEAARRAVRILNSSSRSGLRWAIRRFHAANSVEVLIFLSQLALLSQLPRHLFALAHFLWMKISLSQPDLVG